MSFLIHSVLLVSVLVAAVDEDLSSDESGTKKRRELLARRPSYRKILNDLSSPVSKMDDDSNSSQSQDGQDSFVQASALQLTAHGDATPATQGLQTLTMTNASPTSASNSTGGTTIVQYAQGPDGQFYIPAKKSKRVTIVVIVVVAVAATAIEHQEQ
ncbi:cAMP-responsive element modulator [Elysia marginata]|uniref:cAMP-responsive element modulator n=1 Tax=Elysia marginata TaxID=1093978 RepID=A0AAV4ER24_9GAST|nr:cAMP-responsive element modulator [Elysia marginata]